ncbi:putative peptide/nitrate transporter [Capsicum baccatum]|uniref:Peptide/nitrate transporter n=1 Tax=Capsicum baccatum TaxID=33114 RepID=A0A2G2WTX4_CAPBA|nr:putative peptide/nitrate transporter [Capsicum baccatum]
MPAGTALPISSLFPFLYFMVRDFHTADREENISYYAGYVALTSIPWGMIADRYGRKPVIVIGAITVVIFNALFGLSTNFWMAIVMRHMLLRFAEKNNMLWGYLLRRSTSIKKGTKIKVIPMMLQKELRMVYICLRESMTHSESKIPNSQKSLLKNWPLVSAIIVYCVFQLHDMAYLEIFSLWAVNPRSLGGLSFTTADVGQVLAITGVGLLVFQLFVYPLVERIFGPVMVSRAGAVLSIPLLASYPYIALLSGFCLSIVLNCVSVLKNVLSVSFSTGLLILQNTAVPQEQRGASNGVSMCLMSFAKTIGPAAGGSLLSWAQRHQDADILPGDQLVFFILNVIEFLALLLTFKPFLQEPKDNIPKSKHEESADQENGIQERRSQSELP